MFSGGKDSLVTLNLVKEVSNERGIPKVKVCFRDEELIPANVIEIVEKYQKMDWVDMLYLCVPLASTKYILGKTVEYVQWDSNRRHIRLMPANAFKLPAGDERVFDQHTMDSFTAAFYNGKIAFCTGIRAIRINYAIQGVL